MQLTDLLAYFIPSPIHTLLTNCFAGVVVTRLETAPEVNEKYILSANRFESNARDITVSSIDAPPEGVTNGICTRLWRCSMHALPLLFVAL